MTDDLSDWTPEDWSALQAELDELEATDPGVAAAAEAYRVARERILRAARPEEYPEGDEQAHQ